MKPAKTPPRKEERSRLFPRNVHSSVGHGDVSPSLPSTSIACVSPRIVTVRTPTGATSGPRAFVSAHVAGRQDCGRTNIWGPVCGVGARRLLTGLQSRHQEQRAVECHGTMHIVSAHEISQYAPRAGFLEGSTILVASPKDRAEGSPRILHQTRPVDLAKNTNKVNPTTRELSLFSWL